MVQAKTKTFVLKYLFSELRLGTSCAKWNTLLTTGHDLSQ